VSSNIGEVKKFGISEENIFPVWGWVGGWYSLWPAMIAIYLGMRQFQEFLDGANEMDQQFKCADLSENMPVLLALLGIWYNNFGGYSSHALLPYDQHMKYFADYLQQPDMESNGKSVRRIGDGISYSAAPIVWGSAGTDSQHAYFQLLHQGTERTTCDFIVSATGTNELPVHHKKLLANCLFQSEALMKGSVDTVDGLDSFRGNAGSHFPYKQFSGDCPSSTILIDKLTPSGLDDSSLFMSIRNLYRS